MSEYWPRQPQRISQSEINRQNHNKAVDLRRRTLFIAENVASELVKRNVNFNSEIIQANYRKRRASPKLKSLGGGWLLMHDHWTSTRDYNNTTMELSADVGFVLSSVGQVHYYEVNGRDMTLDGRHIIISRFILGIDPALDENTKYYAGSAVDQSLQQRMELLIPNVE